MLPYLRAWEQDTPEDAPKLLGVSAGREEANKAMGLRSPVGLNKQFAMRRVFGVAGTPSAMLVDTDGKIASDVAVGAPAALVPAGADKAAA